MRKLELSDVFKLSEIIDAMGIELDLNKMLDKAKSKEGNVQANMGAELGFKLVKKIHKAEKLVYKFIADLTGDDMQKVKKYSLKQLIEFFQELFNDEDIVDFFIQE
ncbi:hypothetical protein SAMN05421839_1065 [Halolactibacillus halophilus]|uniref:Uncharacterized protein n=1 Tax=Halolactibacillus halophilus TaxID=306540 RepID=A0A1I5MLS1_9BACI|nr:hypothetical protein [Halolactibacillus halophilus]GEM02496.1 hypothetical protein HHA03_20280 [Halolactibacillus halophilus]SFP10247.1 hypothetical protein SAMN05421839_1065 [Halolactibacillus halophilus]